MTVTQTEFNPKEWENWPEEHKQRLINMIEAAKKERKLWYCNRGRKCDGMEHEGFPYRHARGDQWPPLGMDWHVWLLMGGRGSGKTRSGAEWVRYTSRKVGRIAIVGPTANHVRETMIEGESGLLAVFDAAQTSVVFEPSKRRITLPNGHTIHGFSGEEPDRLRGPQHGAAWLDEPAHFARIVEVWDNLMLGLRLGLDPRALCSTTPLPTKWLKELVAAPDTQMVRASTYANLANLAPTFRKTVLDKYEGTRLGDQELHGMILDDIEGAMWNWDMIQDNRDATVTPEMMDRIVVAIDPAGTSMKTRDQTGIVVVGKMGDQYYVLADYSDHYSPDGWAKKSWKAFDEFKADKVIAEKNYGGEMVLSTLRNERADGPVDLVHSRRGKKLRAEPIVGLYEQGRVHHIDVFKDMETQMTEWVPGVGDSPDRVDALVHGITDLVGKDAPAQIATPAKGNSNGFRAGRRRLQMGREVIRLGIGR